ncbi:uncharacterized protein LOC131933800 [Physella acuta]|uniref:uncharacterized protein LOC131933800 n=1 Tax=Physella acuta TaxID=109671 RepID=UPI0027DE38B1|nr:uncharacterized protein LOC131933800 [Physella acuta]
MKPISSPDSALPKLMKNKNGDVSFHQILNGQCEKEKVPKLRQRSSKQVGQSLADARRRFENRQKNCQEKPVEQGVVVTSSSSETVMDRDQLISMQVKDAEVKPPCEGPSTTPRVTTTQGDDTQTKVRAVEPGFKTLSAEELQKRSVTTFEKTVFILKWIKDVQRLCPTIHPENYLDSPDTNPQTQPCSQNL